MSQRGFQKGHESEGKPKNSKTVKSNVSYEDFIKRVKNEGSIAEFVHFSGIANSTINGWKSSEEGVPLSALRILELYEIKNKVFNLY